MRHEIDVTAIGPQGPAMADAVGACVHCGFCLPTCPTYRVLGEEMDSPRGRIVLMKEALEGSVALDTALPYIDRCVGCLACVTACPSGVEYGELILAFRGHAEKQRHRPLLERANRAGLLSTLPYPRRAAPLTMLGQVARPLAGRLPRQLRTPLELLPRRMTLPRRLPGFVAARGARRARVALLAGCVQQVIDQRINLATLRILSRNGVEVVVPTGQGCCGALPMHTGDQDRARSLARRNLHAFPSDVDAVITNAAGCGAGMHEYDVLFAGDSQEDAARKLATKVRDVSIFLDELGLSAEPPPLPEPVTVAYHDACHLAHAQAARTQPRRLLGAIPNLTVAEPVEWELCCGSAGTYNLEQPVIAEQLGERKARNLEATGAQAIVAGNLGCLTQIARYTGLPGYHTVQLLDLAYRGRRPRLAGSGSGQPRS
jgi:glycolate oxidase iron-sulfur subunit